MDSSCRDRQPSPGHDAQLGASSLRLPYKRLKSRRHTQYAPVRERGQCGAGLPEYWSAVRRDIRTSTLLAATVVLLYRYAGQPVIPVHYAGKVLAVPVCGSTDIQNLVDGLTAGEFEVQPEPGVDVPAAVTILDSMPRRKMPYRDAGGGHSIPELDMNFLFAVRGDELEFAIDHNSFLFERTCVSRMLGHLERVLVAIASGQVGKVGELALFTAQEERWYLEHGSGGSVDYPDYPVHRDVEWHARKTPQKTAVRYAGRALGYGDLNRQSNQLARYLMSRQLGAEDRIAVCLDPGFEVAITLLAIFKIGAVYVPVNPTHPPRRVREIVEDVAPGLIVTTDRYRGLFENKDSVAITFAETAGELPAYSDSDPEVDVDLRQAAYIYYTSGTTGLPKGVQATYANLAHFVRVSRDHYRIGPDDVMPAVASFTFSISMFELMAPLVAGGTLLLLDRAHVLDVARMAQTLEEVSIVHIGPSLFRNIFKYLRARNIGPDRFDNLRHVSSGGDAVPPELLRDFGRWFRAAELYVIYGCSEISLMGCTWRVPTQRKFDKTLVGRPFANVELLVLDEDGNRVPVGSVGNVCFGGHGVTRGYLNREQLTSESYFSRESSRFYRTGDRGKLDEDGNLELLGRQDFQVQFHGMRIELGEIEHHLREASGVQSCVVAMREAQGREKALIAYVVADDGVSVDSGDLRRHMEDRLPGYMVPGFYMLLDALPLNVNMKVDRRALPEYRQQVSRSVSPPETDTEKALAGIWSQLLKMEPVGLEDNFLMLGGDSITAMEMIFLVEAATGYKLDGMDVLRESLHVLARLCDGKSEVDDSAGAPLADLATRPPKSFYFGPEKELYGIYNEPAGPVGGAPVLVVPPLGQEYARCYYLLKRLASNLADAGVAVMRFDFFGTGDSLGATMDASIDRWRSDVTAAAKELRALSGQDSISVVAVRYGALLAARALQREPIDQWVLWDPVMAGDSYFRQLERMQREKVASSLALRNLKRPKSLQGSVELLGLTLSDTSVHALKSDYLEDRAFESGASVHCLLSRECHDLQSSINSLLPASSGQSIDAIDPDCHWNCSAHLGEAIVHREILAKLFARCRAFKP